MKTEYYDKVLEKYMLSMGHAYVYYFSKNYILCYEIRQNVKTSPFCFVAKQFLSEKNPQNLRD